MGPRPSLGVVEAGAPLLGVCLSCSPLPGRLSWTFLGLPGWTHGFPVWPSLHLRCHFNIKASSLPSWRSSICSVAFSFIPVFVQNDNTLDQTLFFGQYTRVVQQVQFCWSICFRQGSMVTATPTPLRPDVILVTSLQVSVSGS